jgi:rSAM/selenodomain-associated transferase 2
VSVVVPTLDEAAVLASTLDRLVAALPPGCEVVVADGGSSDGTLEIAALRARVVPAPRGRGPQLNAGAAAARGEVLVFLHADCWPEPGAVEEAVGRLADPRVAAVAFSQRLEGRRWIYRWIERAADLRVRWFQSVYGDSGLALRRETFERIGGYPDVPLFEDLGISERLRRAGGRVELARAPLHVSTRRWERRGPLRRTLANWLLTLRYKAGADPKALAPAYGKE